MFKDPWLWVECSCSSSLLLTSLFQLVEVKNILNGGGVDILGRLSSHRCLQPMSSHVEYVHGAPFPFPAHQGQIMCFMGIKSSLQFTQEIWHLSPEYIIKSILTCYFNLYVKCIYKAAVCDLSKCPGINSLLEEDDFALP